MTTDRPGDPWSEATYKGFAGPAQPPPRRWRLPAISRRHVAIGAVAAVALGLVLGVWARPNLSGKAGSDSAEGAGPAVPIEVNRPPPLPTPAANGKLEVLPPDQAAAARAPSYAQDGASPFVAVQPSLPALAPPPPLPAQSAPAPALRQPPPLAIAPPRLAQADGRAGFDCSGARSGAEQMVCGDPDLAAQDREMARAYRRALAAGVSPAALRADQRDWLAIREDAARHSRRAVADIYRQRIDELNGIAAGGDDRGDDEGPGL